MFQKHILRPLAGLVLYASPVSAGLVNVDINGPGGATHAGPDGALSTTGTRWNGVVYNVDTPALLDEFGVGTPFSLVYIRSKPLGPFLDFAALNNLQDDGVTGEGFEIRGLDPNARYTLVVYSTANATFNLLDAAGNHGGRCSNAAPSYLLPGVEGRDYCRFVDLVPFAVAPGAYGIRLSGLVGAVTGWQLLGTPPPDVTPPTCSGASFEGPPAGFRVAIQDGESGLESITATYVLNANVTIPAVVTGTHEVVTVEITQIDVYQAARVELNSSDVAGNVQSCVFEMAAGTPPPPEDTEPPLCTGRLIEGSPLSVEITVVDGQSGLATIEIVTGDNVSVTLPEVVSGTTEPVIVTVAKADPLVLARIEIASSDQAGHRSTCVFEIPAEPAEGPCQNPEGCCEETMGFYEAVAQGGQLIGNGPGMSGAAHRRIFERQLERICELIGEGNLADACRELTVALRRVDGAPSPADFVIGPAAPQMAERIRDLQAKLACRPETATSSSTSTGTTSAAIWREPVSWGVIKALYDTSQ